MKPRLLDLFSCAGGAARGYQNAGFYVVGVDIKPQPNYAGDEFHQLDAMAMTQDIINGCWHEGVGSSLPGMSTVCLGKFDAVHASPPCQAYGSFVPLNRARGYESKFPKLIGPTRDILRASGLPYVIENVERARPDMIDPFKLCGSMFGLRVRRHRLFETNFAVLGSHCQHRGHDFIGVYGDHAQSGDAQYDGYERKPRAATIDEAREAMGIDWMDWNEIREAIPPAYTEYIGSQLLQHLRAAA